MKKKTLGRESILKTQIFESYKAELAKEHNFGELEKKENERDKKYTHLGRS